MVPLRLTDWVQQRIKMPCNKSECEKQKYCLVSATWQHQKIVLKSNSMLSMCEWSHLQHTKKALDKDCMVAPCIHCFRKQAGRLFVATNPMLADDGQSDSLGFLRLLSSLSFNHESRLNHWATKIQTSRLPCMHAGFQFELCVPTFFTTQNVRVFKQDVGSIALFLFPFCLRLKTNHFLFYASLSNLQINRSHRSNPKVVPL